MRQWQISVIFSDKPLGARRDSATYVRMKKKACTEIGIASFGTDFEADVTQEQLIAKIDELNAGTASMISTQSIFSTCTAMVYFLYQLYLDSSFLTYCHKYLHLLFVKDPNVNGILVQLPLPGHLDEQAIIERIAQHKDVDGLHPLNVAQLANTKTHAPGRAAWSLDSIGFHVSCTPQVINW